MALSLLVMTPQKLIYNGPVITVSSKNAKGVFDVLRQHANFITLIADFLEIQTEKGGNKQRMAIDQGVLRVNKDQVKVFLGLWGQKQLTGSQKPKVMASRAAPSKPQQKEKQG